MRKRIWSLIGIIIVIIIALGAMSGFIIDIEWFKETGYLNVFLTSFKAKIFIFIPALLILWLLIGLFLSYLRNNYVKAENVLYDKKQLKTQGRIIRWTSFVMSVLLSLIFTGVFWYRILEFVNASKFNINDPVFNKDVGFYIFRLPLIEAIAGVLVAIVIILIVITLIFYGILKAKTGISGLRGIINGTDSAAIKFIAKLLATLCAILLLLFAGVFYIRGLNLVYSSRGVAFGASYTDIHVTLPMYRIISVCCIIASIIVAYSVIRKKVKPVLLTVGLIIILMISQTILSAFVEQFIVSPNAREKEKPYLASNIKFTRSAFGLDGIEQKNFTSDNNLTAKDISDNKDTTDNIRINEFSQALDVFNQLQSVVNYYKFNDVDIDRYSINGKLRQTFLSARELDNSSRDAKFQTWQNKHLFYTHGYGAVMTYTNTVNSSGLPDFIVKDMPITGPVKIEKPQIYFGETNNDYIIVGGNNSEVDYPSGTENKTTKYTGTAGIKLNLLNRFLFTVNTGSLNFFLSQDINSNSKVVLNRRIIDRVEKIAPFLNYDNDPYLVVSNGKLYWIIDAYTTSDRYPFSEQYEGINYIRNSVKVVIDAYDGKTDFYLSDSTDAMAQTINRIYGGILKNIKLMPSDLRKHIRYSEDVFAVQSLVYQKYHMSDPVVFYNSEDLWETAKYRTSDGQQDVNVEPVYQVMRLPGEKDEKFLLTIPFTVAKKENMVSWLAVEMSENGSRMVLMKFPKDKATYGPQQISSKMNTDTEVVKFKTLQQTSQIIFGETNIIPIKNSLLYVRPLYLKSQGKSIPELKKIVVGFGDKIVLADNISDAFNKLFNTAAVEENQIDETQDTKANSKTLVEKAADMFTKAKNAQTSGDWASYGKYLKELEKVINELKIKVK